MNWVRPGDDDCGCGQRVEAGLADGKDFGKARHGRTASGTGIPAPKAIGIDEISLKEGHIYRSVVSDLVRRRPIWFGGKDRSEESLDLFYQRLGPKKSAGIRLSVMDMWKAFEKSTRKNLPQTAILYDKFNVMRHLGGALDKIRKQEYARVSGNGRSFIKGQKYALLSNRENLTSEGRKALKKLLGANKRLHTTIY